MRGATAVGVMVIVCAMAFAVTAEVARGEEGSIGGGLGKRDKSASGGEETPVDSATRYPVRPKTTDANQHADEIRHLTGTWAGGDWGTITISPSGSGRYSTTFNGQPGFIQIHPGKGSSFVGSFHESSATGSDPLRQGNIVATVVARNPEGFATSLNVSWTATDSNRGRTSSGSSTWTREGASR
jgi:hypothetical protein